MTEQFCYIMQRECEREGIWKGHCDTCGVFQKDADKDKDDPVNHPKHYCKGRYESIDVMTEVFGVETVKSFALCNAFKYIWRSDSKGGIEDIRKATWYLQKYLELSEVSK